MSSPLRRTAAVLAAVLALTAAGPPPATAAPPSTVPPVTGSLAALGAAAAGSRVTLITGDVVEVSPAGAGRYAASVRPAAGRERITFHTVEVDGGLRVLPSDVVPYVSAGTLDADLFDVEELIADGYADAAAASLPLIVRYQNTAAGTARALAGTTNTRPLASIGGAALAAGKDSLAGFWQQVRPADPSRSAATSALGAGISQIWLDGRVRPVLDRSVAQIGAPAAWQAGLDGSGVKVAVLDTGVDQTHPDLVGKVTARNFSGSPDTTDHHGHGTHVAATVAGTGAGSGGTRRGVAPGASLLAGKVLGDDGVGYDSWIIAGMEWAAEQGAAVVNMSLGGGPTDGTDPLSQALDRITVDTGTLFVVAAGNEGANYTVGTPGAAPSALTVGAVDRDESLADFSSRGPRLGDEGLKPEITAPGVGIVAARAAGTGMGTPVDDRYTAASGTSMATPHVAGAAALLAQAHPDWSPARLKDALVSTARTNPELSVFDEGTGRVDVARAVGQRVYASSQVDFGLHTDPDDAATARTGAAAVPVGKVVTYTNDGPAPVTLSLAVELENVATEVPETDAVTTGSGTVTVPAGGSIEVPVTVDLAKLDRGLFGGWITATGPGGVLASTAVGVSLDGPRHKVTLRAVGRAGQPVAVPVLALMGDNYRWDNLNFLWPEETKTIEVGEGTYLLHALIEDGGVLDEQATLITDPELRVDRDIEVLLDARKGTPIRIETPRPAEQQAVLSYYSHRVTGTGRQISHGTMHFSTIQQVNVTPTGRLTSGQYEFSSRWQLVAPMVRAEVAGVSGPFDINLTGQSPAYDGTRRFPLVHAGRGTPEELAQAKVRGAAVLIESSNEPGGEDAPSESEVTAAAARAGAAVTLMVRPADWSAWTVWRPLGDREPIPMLAVANDDGQRLIARAQRGRATLSLTLTTSSPYLYDVQHVERNRIPDRIVYRVTPANSTRITTRYADNGGFPWAKEQRFGWRPWQTYAWNDTSRFVATPKEREEWVTTGDSVWQHRVSHEWPWNEMGALDSGMAERPTSYRARSAEETWLAPVVRPASPRGIPELVSTRTGNTLALRVPEFVDAEGHYTIGETFRVGAMLWRDGKLLAELPDARQDVTTTGPEAGYRLALTTERGGEEWIWGTRTETVWEFRSGQRSGNEARPLPLLQVDYAAPVDLTGRASGRPHTVGLKVRHQDGHPAANGTGLTAEVSFDEGATWRPVRVAGYGNAYQASVPAGKGTVSLRVRATDRSGNAVTQTVIRAYGLR
ncbi:S8 family serine peptidase [Plantactinospora sp. KLBMP9567]|uniref:S8 family serine peptidase n=1 Tax=Plantactinospora sp. KLBMP9567 TaxID=3085900 RepID=UPI002982977B|nr:S8 family serine peptidase [Plantactinospora sp. KLBMP9567]MDW5325002.1 S8 family serine peptidase [Plantactinospora sp. KLBMP9567]